MSLKPLTSLKNIAGQRVLVHCDFNIPLARRGQTRTGTRTNAELKIADDSRLRACLPTIQYLLKKKAKIILIGHLGRPGGQSVPELSLAPVKDRLEQLLRITDYPPTGDPQSPNRKNSQGKLGDRLRITFVAKIDRYVGQSAKAAVVQMKPGEIVMLENLRFSDREELNCRRFAKKLAALADYYINEAFAVSHRNEASVSAIREYLPSYAGLHLAKEIKQLSLVVSHPLKPLVLIIGGAKIETKLPVIKQFIGKADYILIGGAVANDFFKALGYEVGQSLIDEEYIKDAKFIVEKLQAPDLKLKINSKFKILNSKLILPADVVTKNTKTQKHKNTAIQAVEKDDKILDIGPATIKLYQNIIRQARMIIWNGPMGKFEDKKFAAGTLAIAKTILKSKAKVVVGGGETGELFKNKKLPHNVFVSVGGGAMLEFLAGKKLPGL